MPVKLSTEARVTIKELDRRGVSRSAIARTLGVTEGAVRYHLERQATGAVDGRSLQEFKAARWAEHINYWIEEIGDDPLNLVLMHEWLVQEKGYDGSARSVQRYVRAKFPRPKRRARRRVETPPGAQGQADWAVFPEILIAGCSERMYTFHLQLSYSRFDAVVWSRRKDQLAWHHVHNEGFRRLEGVPATVRVDNEKTAIARGAGAWGEINTAYRRYSETVRFHIDACPPRDPGAKGKIERRIRHHRLCADPRGRHWSDLSELQEWTDEQVLRSAERRICPATGTSVMEAWRQEQRYLAPLPPLPEPFDLAVTRRVGADCTVRFEGRSYSVPFRLVDQHVEVRGCASVIQVLAGTQIVATHPRHTPERILLDPSHFEGPATEKVLPPPPLGRMGRRLEEIAQSPPEQRPLDLYAALAEVAR